jgi:hypothetical protein
VRKARRGRAIRVSARSGRAVDRCLYGTVGASTARARGSHAELAR